MGKEIKMKDADASSSKSKEQSKDDKKAAHEQPSPPSVKAMLSANVLLLEAAVRAKETRVLAGRLMRQTTSVRRKLTADDLSAFVRETLPHGYPGTSLLLEHLSKVCQSPLKQSKHRCRCIHIVDCLPPARRPGPPLQLLQHASGNVLRRNRQLADL